MRKKNLKIQVAALAVTGAIATTPFVARADETSSAAATSTEATATTTATEAGTTTAGTTTAAAATPAASTTTAAPASTTTTAASTAATTGTTTAAPAAVSSDVIENSDGSISFREPAADPGTTAPNNVDTVVSDDTMQGTDIHFKADGEVKKTISFLGFTSEIKIPVHKDYNAEINPEDTKDDKKLKETVEEFKNTDLGELKNNDLVMHGDLSIQKDGDTTPFDSTSDKAKDVEKTDTYTLKAKLDVSPVHNTINAMNSLVGNFTNNGNDVYVNNLETGLRATFTMENNLNGSFHLPTDLEDAKKHYELSSADADGKSMIYRINYGNSSFAEDKVTLAMDLDLTKMGSLPNQYSSAGADYKNLYGKDSATGKANHVENFNHPNSAYGTYYQTSVFGNLKELVNHSAKTIQLIMKGIKFNSANGNRVESESNTETTATERITDKTVTTEGTVLGTLVGYMNADTGKENVQGKAKFVWGAIQNDAGRDSVAGQDNDKVYLTVKFTDKERTVTPITPVNPVQPENPTNPVTPSNGGNGGNGGSRTPIVNPSTPSQPGNVLGEDRPTPSNQGEVLGENRPAPTAVETVEKKGEVLGESRPSGKNVSGRAAVATGDNNFTALWASLFGLSAASLAGFVVLRKKEQEA